MRFRDRVELRSEVEGCRLGRLAGPIADLARPAVVLVPRTVHWSPETDDTWRPGGGQRVDRLAVGSHTLAITDTGSLFAWGRNDHGQLGDGSRADNSNPVALDIEAAAVAVGTGHSLALGLDGTVWAWGWNGGGQLGDGTTEDRWVPTPVDGLEHVTAVAAAGSASFAVVDGVVFGWGRGAAGWLVDGETTQPRPASIPALDGVRLLRPFTGVLADGSTVEWGPRPTTPGGGRTSIRPHSLVGVVGLPSTPTSLATGVAVVGGAHRLAVVDGSVWAWGANRYGQLGDGTSTDRDDPAPVAGLDRAVAVAAGWHHSVALDDRGNVWTWGSNSDGQLGETDIAFRHRPGLVQNVPPIAHIAAGGAATVVAATEGSVISWGARPIAEVTDPTPIGTSKLGGQPDLPAGASWPQFRDQPQAFVGQINLAELGAAGLPELPRSGLLSFFFDCDQRVTGEPGDDEGWAVVFSADGSELERRDFPGVVPSASRFRATGLAFENELTVPPVAAEVFRPLALSRAEEEAYQDFLYAHPTAQGSGHQLLGFYDPVQPSHSQELLVADHSGLGGDDWRLLLQVDSDAATGMDWGGGRLYYWIRDADLAALRFDRAWMIAQS